MKNCDYIEANSLQSLYDTSIALAIKERVVSMDSSSAFEAGCIVRNILPSIISANELLNGLEKKVDSFSRLEMTKVVDVLSNVFEENMS